MTTVLGIGFSESDRKLLREKIAPARDFQFCSHPREAMRKHQKSPRDIFLLENIFSSEETAQFINQLRKTIDLADGEAVLLAIQAKSQAQNLALLQKTAHEVFFLREEKLQNDIDLIAQFLKRNSEMLKLRRMNFILGYEQKIFENNLQQLLPVESGAIIPPSLQGTSAAIHALREKLKFCAFDVQPVLVRAEHVQCMYDATRYVRDIRSDRFKGIFSEIDFSAIPEFLHANILWGDKISAKSGKKISSLIRNPMSENKEAITIVLYNIEYLSWENQGKLMKYLRSRNERLRARQLLILTTTGDLEKSVTAGRFRQDLFYHMQINPISFPALGTRTSDIMQIAKSYLSASGFYALQTKRENEIRIDNAKLLKADSYTKLYENLNTILHQSIRPFENTGARAENGKIFREGLQPNDKPLTLSEMEKQYIITILTMYHGNMTDSAKSLGIARKTLYDKIKKYGISAAHFSKAAQ